MSTHEFIVYLFLMSLFFFLNKMKNAEIIVLLFPPGACIRLKDPSLAVAVESCLRSFMKTFCCDNYKDERVLQELMAPHFSKGSRPQIVVCSFTEHVYNVQHRLVFHFLFK